MEDMHIGIEEVLEVCAGRVTPDPNTLYIIAI